MRETLAVCAALCIFWVSGCTSNPSIDAYVSSITPLPSTVLEQRARLKLRLQNLSENEVSATGIDVRLVVNGRQLARGVAAQDISIAGLSDTTTSVDVSSRVIDTVRQIIGFQGREVFTYRLKGRLIKEGIDQRFNHGGEISRQELSQLLSPSQRPAN